MQHISCALLIRDLWKPSMGFSLALLILGQTVSAQEEASVIPAEEPKPQPQETKVVPEGDPVEESEPRPKGSGSEPTDHETIAPLDMKAWKKRYRKYNSWEGATGGMHLVDPTTGASGSVRIQMGIQVFDASDFLAENDNVEQFSQSLSISWTPTQYMELFGSIVNRSTAVNQLDYETRTEDPRLENDFHSQGDAILGLKAGAFVSPIVSVGGDVSMFMPNQAGTAGVQLNGISARVRGDLMVDLQRDKEPLPFIGRFNMDYRFDHSEALIDDIEDRRYEILVSKNPDRLVKDKDIDHFISRVERFAFSVNRVDLFSLGIGVEIPLEVAEEFYLQPLMEWRMSFPINRRDFLCPFQKQQDDSDSDTESNPFPDDSCGNQESASAFPSTLGFGIRGITPIRGVSALFGIDVGLTGTSTFIRELKPTAPYQVLFVISYDYDARPQEARYVEVKGKEPPPPTKSHIKGLVFQQDGTTRKPIADAIIKFANTELSPLTTDENGRFISYGFGPSSIEMDISHPNFQPGKCTAEIKEKDGDVEVECSLMPLPETGEINGRVTDIWNMPISGAKVEIGGATSATLFTDQDGIFSRKVEPGDYTLRIESDRYLIRLANLSLKPRENLTPVFVLAEKTEEITIVIRRGTFRINTPIKFARYSSELTSSSSKIVAQLADYLLRNPQIQKIKVFGSTDRGAQDSMITLTRALAIKRALVNAGVYPERVEAMGGESTRVKIIVE